jgi:hypothetical protein
VDLNWMGVAIAGCVALAACIAVVLLRPMGRERRRLRPLANAHRLTTLPEYVSAKRARTRMAILTMALLVTIFACATIVAARPTGLPTAAHPFDGGAPEDVMVCIGGRLDEPAVEATLSYFADHVTGFGTQRIGLTSPNRRVIPLTRDYQYARDTFARYATDTDRRGDSGPFSPAVSYVDYAETIDDVLALCLTGFPGFDRPSAQRRSLIYVGPGVLRAPDDPRPALFTSDRISDMATAADVQVNAVITGPDAPALAARANATGGRSFPAGPDIAARLTEIRDHPPAARLGDEGADRREPTESPDVPLAIALLAAVALAAVPVVWRR